jgi:hypothetical protein
MKEQTKKLAPVTQVVSAAATLLHETEGFTMPTSERVGKYSDVRVELYQVETDTVVTFDRLPFGIEAQTVGVFIGSVMDAVHDTATFGRSMGGKLFNCKFPVHMRVVLGDAVYDSAKVIKREFYSRLKFGYSSTSFKRFASRHYSVFTKAVTSRKLITISEFLKQLEHSQV